MTYLKIKCYLFLLLALTSCRSYSQQQSFDIVNFTAPKGWKKQTSESSVQFSKEEAASGKYCIITILKAVQGSTDAIANFEAAWENVVKEMVTVKDAPVMEASAEEDGWEVQSGHAPFESDGQTGVALLVTASGYEKMINMLILTNTDTYEPEMTAFMESISFKKQPAIKNDSPTKTGKTSEPLSVAKKDGFAFTSTNFDDGWTSTVQEDWVEVTKSGIKVLVHYPNKKADEYNSVLLDGLKNAWDVLVSQRYSSATNFEFKPVSGWESIEFAEADLVENATGKNVHVVLFKKNFYGGNGKYIEFITSDKQAFEQEFGSYENATANSGSGWDKMISMGNYNKFAVAASDLKGVWTSDFSGLTQYVNAYTGLSAGANTHASNEKFEFGPGNTYKWDLGMASGFVGNIKFQSAKASGKFSVPNNWQVYFSLIEGKPKTYNAYFSCIKGARVLWLQDVSYGGYTGYGRK